MGSMKIGPRPFLPKKRVLALLSFAAWLLLAVSWVMSLYAYHRLPEEMALWSSFWRGEVIWADRSLLFFLFPAVQTLLFFLFLGAARILVFRKSRPGPRTPVLERERAARLQDLRKEVTYLVLIFVNLIFIHLQTSLILLSHQLGRGINRFYVLMLLGVILILIPYYYMRARMLLRE
jgi:uncharacterized membrane protein